MNAHIKIFGLIILISACSQLLAQSNGFGLTEKVGTPLPTDIKLIDSRDSSIVELGSLIDMPTLLTFVYYKCPGLCTPLMDGVAEVIDLMDLTLDEDYKIITVSIDYKETSDLAIKKKNNYLATMGKTEEASNAWLFFTADSANISRLTSATGYKFKREQNNFIHPVVSVLLTPKGKISQYFYGKFFLPMHLKMGIRDAWEEKTNSTRIKDLKYCYNFTPPENQLVRLIVVVSGSILVAISIALFLILLVKNKTKFN